MVVDEYTNGGVKRVLGVACRDHTRAVMLPPGWHGAKNLVSFSLYPTTHLVKKPGKLVEFIVTFVRR